MSQPTILIPLYIRGAVVPTSVGTTMHMAPLDTSPDQIVRVEVEGISFLISRGMVLDTKEYKYGIPMKGNYFAKALLNQPERDTIVIENRADTLGEAKFYPVIFDFLRRRFQSSSYYYQEPLHEYVMGIHDAVRLHSLVDALFMVDPDQMLPVSPSKGYVHIATMPSSRSHSRHDISAAMCLDPRFVRLVQEVQDIDRKTDKDSKNARRNMLKQLKEDYHLDSFPYDTLRRSTVHAIERGTLFAIDVQEVDHNDDILISVVYDSVNYNCA